MALILGLALGLANDQLRFLSDAEEKDRNFQLGYREKKWDRKFEFGWKITFIVLAQTSKNYLTARWCKAWKKWKKWRTHLGGSQKLKRWTQSKPKIFFRTPVVSRSTSPLIFRFPGAWKHPGHTQRGLQNRFGHQRTRTWRKSDIWSQVLIIRILYVYFIYLFYYLLFFEFLFYFYWYPTPSKRWQGHVIWPSKRRLTNVPQAHSPSPTTVLEARDERRGEVINRTRIHST